MLFKKTEKARGRPQNFESPPANDQVLIKSTLELLQIKSQDFSVDTKKRLGSGHFAHVYRGKFKGDNVAVKIFRDTITTDEFGATFQNEQRALQATVNEHPKHIVVV